MYGDPANDTLRVVYNPHEIHPWQHFSTESAGYTVDFFTTAFQMENPIPSSNQYWLWKELFNCIGLVAVSYTHLRAHETGRKLVCRLLLEKKK